MENKAMEITRLIVCCNFSPCFYNREFDTKWGCTITREGHNFVVRDDESIIEISDSLPHIVEYSK
jgi:hypothetical protein